MKKYRVLLLVLCPMAYAMDFRDAVRSERRRVVSRQERAQVLRDVQARVDELEASGDEAGEDLDKILGNTVSIKKKVKANRELLLDLRQQVHEVAQDDEQVVGLKRQVADLACQLQILVVAHKAQERALATRAEDPVIARLRRLEGTTDAISERQITNSRYSYLGAFVGIGFICAKLGMTYLFPDWVWDYLPGAS